MQLKELTIKELLGLFDATTHEQIVEYYENPEVHYIVVFANHFQADMGLLTVGPSQDCTSLEQAKRAIIDRKFAKFVVKCRNCPVEKKKSETTFGGLVRPIDRGTTLEAVTPAPIPAAQPAAARPAIALPTPAAKTAAPAAAPVAAVAAASLPAAAPAVAAPALSPDKLAEIAAREEALAKKELALKAIEDDLKMRESELVDREEYVTQSEESLIEKIQKQERRGAELEQQEENNRKRLEDIVKREAKIADFLSKNPGASV